MCNLHFAIHQGSPSFYSFTHERIIMFLAITDLILNTEVFKIPAIVRWYQIQTPLRPRWRNSWLSERCGHLHGRWQGQKYQVYYQESNLYKGFYILGGRDSDRVSHRCSAPYTLLPLRGISPTGKRVTGLAGRFSPLWIQFPCHRKGKQEIWGEQQRVIYFMYHSSVPPLVAGATTFPPQFGGAAKGKRLNGQARRLTSPHLEVLCRTSTVAQ